MQPHSNAYGTGGGPGGIAYSDSAPGGFRFLSPCRKEQRDSCEQIGNVHISKVNGGVSRWLPQSLRDSSLPEGAQVHCHAAGLPRPPGTPSVGFAATYPQPQSARPPLTGCRLFRLTRSSRFRLRRTAHWADTRIAPLREGGSVYAPRSCFPSPSPLPVAPKALCVVYSHIRRIDPI